DRRWPRRDGVSCPRRGADLPRRARTMVGGVRPPRRAGAAPVPFTAPTGCRACAETVVGPRDLTAT
ncbi:hypothetical protein ABT341_29205, partial [Pseudonocardia alni]|uniref:hypothetical protein n=1 Tax=Pseudonocardia alni TaxID=33907 RepID=UPI003316ADC5